MLKTVAKILAKTQNVMVEGESKSMSLEELFLTSVIQNGIRGKNAKSMMQTLEWIREVDIDRARVIAAANETRVHVTADLLKELTSEELQEVYNRTMDPDYRMDTDPILLRHAKKRD